MNGRTSWNAVKRDLGPLDSKGITGRGAGSSNRNKTSKEAPKAERYLSLVALIIVDSSLVHCQLNLTIVTPGIEISFVSVRTCGSKVNGMPGGEQNAGKIVLRRI